MASSDPERRVAKYYSARLAEHGPTPAGVDWNSAESQALRFAQLLKVAEGGRPDSVNDYGCGYGALLDHLEGLGGGIRYHGFDVSTAMIDAARARHAEGPSVSFSVNPADTPNGEVTVASGLFNVKAGTPSDEWDAYVRATVRRMWATSSKGMAFNMLTSYSDPERMTERLHYADPLEMFDWCKRELSRHVALLHDYGLYEFTLIVRAQQDETA